MKLTIEVDEAEARYVAGHLMISGVVYARIGEAIAAALPPEGRDHIMTGHRVHIDGYHDDAIWRLECIHGPDEYQTYSERLVGPCRCQVDFPPGCEMCGPGPDEPDHYGCENYDVHIDAIGPMCQADPCPGDCYVQPFWDELGTELMGGKWEGPPPWDVDVYWDGEYPVLRRRIAELEQRVAAWTLDRRVKPLRGDKSC